MTKNRGIGRWPWMALALLALTGTARAASTPPPRVIELTATVTADREVGQDIHPGPGLSATRCDGEVPISPSEFALDPERGDYGKKTTSDVYGIIHGASLRVKARDNRVW